jgi:zinc/manganese transport system substrate-binding protein
MKERIPAVIVLALLLIGRPAWADLAVVATLPDLGAIAAAVGGDHVEVQIIASPSEDPHYVDPRPSHLVTLSRADVLIANGLGLEEGWLPPLQTQARNTAIRPGGAGYVDASTMVSRIIGAGVEVDRAMGDVHPGGNPHFTFDPRAARDLAAGFAEVFSGLNPSNATSFEQNRDDFLAELNAVAEAQSARFAQLDAGRLRAVVYHDSLPYLLDWLGIEQVSTVEPTPGVPPDPGRVAEVVGVMRSGGIPVLVQEQFYPSNTSSRVADLAGASLVVIAGGTNVGGGESYVDHLEAIANALYEACAP